MLLIFSGFAMEFARKCTSSLNSSKSNQHKFNNLIMSDLQKKGGYYLHNMHKITPFFLHILLEITPFFLHNMKYEEKN